MATDVDVQFFSHLNGLVLGNNWGDMIRLLDTCLVNGLPLTAITSATVDAQGDINLTLYAAHNCLLFQIVELSGFAPSGFNGKYRIKGTPDSKTLILKATLTGQSITTLGTAKLAPLGYEIAFTGTNKRAYRAKNPSAQHPFIRIDETLSDGTNSYSSDFAKSAMVGLIENMTHIDDYADSSKLQLPLDTVDFAKNWKISGTGDGVTRGMCKWYYAKAYGIRGFVWDSFALPDGGGRQFTLIGSRDCFYLLNECKPDNGKILNGCGVYKSALADDVIPAWFLMATNNINAANYSYSPLYLKAGAPLANRYVDILYGRFFTTKYTITGRLSNNTCAVPIGGSDSSGYNGLFSATPVAALEVPFYDEQGYLRGSLNHVCTSGKTSMPQVTTPILADNSMYIADGCAIDSVATGGFYFYLGEL